MSGIHFPGVQLSLDPTPGDWIVQQLDRWSKHPGTSPASTVIPAGFEAYARIFHPARKQPDRWLTWTEVAAQNGRTVHAEMQWAAISAPATNTADRESWTAAAAPPDQGNLGADRAERLAERLAAFTTSRDSVWFGIWEGYGMLHPDAAATLRAGRYGRLRRLLASRRTARTRRSLRDGFEAIPKLRCDRRAYLVYRGPLLAVRSFQERDRPAAYQSPNLWWPDDRAWCVATEVDFDSTLVGGSRNAIDAVLTSTDVEALEITLQTRLDHRADRINR